jgi:membrane-associated phospholipid phosphatase
VLSDLSWFALILVGGALVVVATQAPRRLLPTWPNRLRGPRVIVVSTFLAIVLVGLCALVRLGVYDRLDASVVGELAHVRSAGLVSVFTILTTMGDVVPSLTVGAILGFALLLRERRIDIALVLPAALLVQMLLQDVLGRLAGTDIAHASPGISLGGAGPIPSGSVSRLYVLFVLGAVLWARSSRRAAKVSVLVGQSLILVELISRLYLGRHFLIDILGGLVLGVLLLVGGSWLVVGLDAVRRRVDGPTSVRSATTAVSGNV